MTASRDATYRTDSPSTPPARWWSDAPSPHLVSQISDVTPGLALDVGCGEGADARWLARHGWRVEGVDASEVAVRRAAEGVQALAPDLASQITWRRADLADEPPEPDRYDLVACHVVHQAPERRRRLVAGLAAAVRRTGTLLVVGHDPHHADGHPDGGPPCAADDLATQLEGPWMVDVCASWPRTVTAEDGDPVTVHDAVLRATRL